MPNPNKKVGRITIKVDGAAIESYPDAEIYTGGIKRTDKENGNHPGHFSEKIEGGSVTCSIDWGVGRSTAEMDGWDDVTVFCECDTGQKYVGNHFYLEQVPPIASEKMELTFRGPRMEEMTSG